MSAVDPLYVVVDIGCRECGVESLVLGVFSSQDEARRAVEDNRAKYDDWRDGGESGAVVFAIPGLDRAGEWGEQ